MGFLSNLCAESIIHIKDPLQRMSAVQYVALIIFNFSSIPLESVLKQSYRARYYLFVAHSSSDDRIGSSGSPLDCIDIPKNHRDYVLKYLSSVIPVSKESRTQDVIEELGFDESHDADKEKEISSGSILTEDIVSWVMVTDESLRAAVGDDTDEDDEENGGNSSNVVGINFIKKKRSLWMKNSGLNVANFFSRTEDQCKRLGKGSKKQTEREGMGGMRWSILGIAMIGETVLGSFTSEIINPSSSSYPSTSDPSFSSNFLSTTAKKSQGVEGGILTGIRSMIPRVYCTDHLWKSFYPLLFPLLSSPQLAAGEGLRLISHLGDLNIPFYIPFDLSHFFSTCTYFILARLHYFFDKNFSLLMWICKSFSCNIVSIIQDPSQSRIPIQSTLSHCPHRVALPTRPKGSLFFLPPSMLQISSFQLDPAENERKKSTDEVEASPYTLISVRSLRKALSTLSNRITDSNHERRNSDRDKLILAGVGVARSLDALTLIQGLISTLVRIIGILITYSIVYLFLN